MCWEKVKSGYQLENSSSVLRALSVSWGRQTTVVCSHRVPSALHLLRREEVTLRKAGRARNCLPGKA